MSEYTSIKLAEIRKNMRKKFSGLKRITEYQIKKLDSLKRKCQTDEPAAILLEKNVTILREFLQKIEKQWLDTWDSW